MKKTKILFIFIILLLIFGLGMINLNLNRQIYMSVISGTDINESINNEYINEWDLDYMVDVLSYPEKYEIKDLNGETDNKNQSINIPKIRVLFNPKPFDFRIDSNKYTFYINNSLMSNFISKLNNTAKVLKDYSKEMVNKARKMPSFF